MRIRVRHTDDIVDDILRRRVRILADNETHGCGCAV